MGRQTSAGWGKHAIFQQMHQHHSPGGADGCCITSDKSLICLQLVFTSNWSDFRHAFASRGLVSVSWAFLSALVRTASRGLKQPKSPNLLQSHARFLADRTNGRAIVTVFRLSVCLSVCTRCIVAKRCVLEQVLLLTAYRKSLMRNRLVPK